MNSSGILTFPFCSDAFVMHLIDLRVGNTKQQFSLLNPKTGKTMNKMCSVAWTNMKFFMVMKDNEFFPLFFPYSREGFLDALTFLHENHVVLYLCETDEYTGINANPIMKIVKNTMECFSNFNVQIQDWTKGTDFERAANDYRNNIETSYSLHMKATSILMSARKLRDFLQKVIDENQEEIAVYSSHEKNRSGKLWGVYPASYNNYPLYYATNLKESRSVIGKEGNLILDWKGIPPYQQKKAILWISEYLMQKGIPVFLIPKEIQEYNL